jgi:hypothetical protein
MIEEILQNISESPPSTLLTISQVLYIILYTSFTSFAKLFIVIIQAVPLFIFPSEFLQLLYKYIFTQLNQHKSLPIRQYAYRYSYT